MSIGTIQSWCSAALPKLRDRCNPSAPSGAGNPPSATTSRSGLDTHAVQPRRPRPGKALTWPSGTVGSSIGETVNEHDPSIKRCLPDLEGLGILRRLVPGPQLLHGGELDD